MIIFHVIFMKMVFLKKHQKYINLEEKCIIKNIYRYRKKIVPFELYNKSITWNEITPQKWNLVEIQSKLKPFIEREIDIIFKNKDYYVCNKIYHYLNKYNTSNDKLTDSLWKYLGNLTNIFLNEIEFYYNSNYVYIKLIQKTLDEFDNNCIYTFKHKK